MKSRKTPSTINITPTFKHETVGKIEARTSEELVAHMEEPTLGFLTRLFGSSDHGFKYLTEELTIDELYDVFRDMNKLTEYIGTFYKNKRV